MKFQKCLLNFFAILNFENRHQIWIRQPYKVRDIHAWLSHFFSNVLIYMWHKGNVAQHFSARICVNDSEGGGGDLFTYIFNSN